MTRKVVFVSFVLVSLLCVSSLAAAAGGFPAGEWAFSSEPAVSVLRVNEEGSVLYNGVEYTCEDDGQFLWLKDADGEVLRLRYLVTEKTVFLYVSNGYSRKEGTAGDGIIGVWDMDGSETSFFEFTANQRFLEDGVFDGKYEVDEENGSFTLIYPMYFGDTVCYFERNGEHMTVEYPWSMKQTVTVP